MILAYNVEPVFESLSGFTMFTPGLCFEFLELIVPPGNTMPATHARGMLSHRR